MSAPASAPGQPEPGAAACDSAMLDALLAQAPVGFAFIDTDLRVRRVSDSLAGMIGLPPGPPASVPLAASWPAAMASVAEAAVRKVLADGMPVVDAFTDRNGTVDGGDVPPLPGRRLALSWYP